MPKYFFHVRDSSDLPDEIGTDLPSDDAAREQAIVASAEAIRDLGARFWNMGHWQMDVVDDTGRDVLVLYFRGEIHDH